MKVSFGAVHSVQTRTPVQPLELEMVLTNTWMNLKVWEKLFSEKKASTFKEVKKHTTVKRATLSGLTRKTFGSGWLDSAVKVPNGVEKNDWLAANTVDFFNELSLLYGLVVDSAQIKYSEPGEGFPPGCEYRWQAHPNQKPVSRPPS